MKKHLLIIIVIMISGFLITSCEKSEPVACFYAGPTNIAGLPTPFSSSCSENAHTFSWSFGDGGTSSEEHPFHTYSVAGTYTVSLVVANSEGETDEESQIITVEAPSLIEHSGNITADETWIEGRHLIVGDVYVDGAILTIEAGATVMFAAGTGLYLGYHSGSSGATMLADGTADKLITFTSAAVTKTPGDWDYIGFYDGSSSASSMQYCVVEYGGGYSSNYGEIYIDGSSVAIDNSTVRYSESIGISAYDEGFFQSFSGNTVTDNGSNPISIYGNYAHTIGAGNNILTVTGILVKGDHIEEADASWLKQTCAYVLDGDVYVGSVTGAKLTLMPGVEIRMGISTGLYIGYSGDFGTLTAEGTAGEHIKFTSSAPGTTKSPGDWDYIGFYDGAGTGSSMAYCDIEYGGGYSSNYGMIYLDGSAISLSNSTVSNSEYIGISLYDGMFATCMDNTFEGNGTVPIEIYANHAHTIGTGNTFNTGPGIIVKGDDVEHADVTWLKHNVPYIVDGDVDVGSNSGAKLTIAPGTTVKFTGGSELRVGYSSGTFGNLIANGEGANRITFTSGAAEGFEAPGDWNGIWFYDGTGSGTILENCIISYGGGYSSNSGNLNMKNEAVGIPVISMCQIENSAAWGIYLDNSANPTLTDNIFGNNASGNTNL